MENNYFTEETRRKSESFTDDEMSSLGMIWAAIMTLIALIQLSLF
jgi:hypothetical protein